MASQRERAAQLSALMIAFFVIWSIRATFGFRIDESISSPIARAAYSNALKFLIWVVPAAAFVSLARHTSSVRYLGITVWPSRVEWLNCIGVTVAFLLAVTIGETAVGHKTLSLTSLSSLPASLWLLQLVVSPFLEEVLFRGFVMTECAALMPKSRAMAVTSLLFTAIHLPFWLSHGGLHPAMLVNSVGVFLFSMVACWLQARTGSVWPSTLAHIANNVVSSMLLAK